MNILIKQTKEILSQLEETHQIINDKNINNDTIDKLGMMYDNLINMSEKLKKLNIKLKSNENIELTYEEKEYLKCEKKSNDLISQVMPALVILNL